MFELLKSFFNQILGYDVQIQKIDEDTFVITGKELADIPYQGNYVSNLLEGYGLNNTVTFREGEVPSIIIDFAAKWQPSIESHSYKFLPPHVEHWYETDLNRYASLVETMGLWDLRTKLASNLLLLFNFYKKKKVGKISVTLEQGKYSQFLTYHERPTSTVFQRIGENEIELQNLGPAANTLRVLNASLFDHFTMFNKKEMSFEMSSDGVLLDDKLFPEAQLLNIQNAAAYVGSTTNLNQKIKSLTRIYQLAKKIL